MGKGSNNTTRLDIILYLSGIMNVVINITWYTYGNVLLLTNNEVN